MKKIILLAVFLLIPMQASAQSSALAIVQQTIIQTAEHLQRLKNAVQQVSVLKKQLELAIESSKGITDVGFVSDFKNIVVETTNLLSSLDVYISKQGNMSDEWKDVFGNLKDWGNQGKEFNYIEMSDDINVAGYQIADSYQEIYSKNSQYAQQFISHSKTVNEKGALRAIAEELGHLMQLQNHVTYLMSQSIKQQSVEHSNRNLERKEAVVELQKENEGVRRFMDVASKDFPM